MCLKQTFWKTHEEREERKRECVAADIIIESFRYSTMVFGHSASNTPDLRLYSLSEIKATIILEIANSVRVSVSSSDLF
jgi:hypothetical protein